MNEYLKTQLRLMIIGTVIWIAAFCIALSEYPYYISGRMIPVIICGGMWVVFWVQWTKDYKKQK
jgi:hypothetical protein